jgi:hypothetical protein
MCVASLLAVAAPLHLHDDWQRPQRMVDEFEDSKLEGSELGAEDFAALLRKRPDGFAISWSQRRVCILETTRAYDAGKDVGGIHG